MRRFPVELERVPYAQLILMAATLARRREAEAGQGDRYGPHKRTAARKSSALERATRASHEAMKARG